jgi:hypothetical protein
MRTPAKLLAIAAAGGALAVGVPAALAATDAPDTTNTPVQSATPAPDQQRGERPNGDDCPEKDGQGGGGSDSNQGSTAPDAPTATPDV